MVSCVNHRVLRPPHVSHPEPFVRGWANLDKMFAVSHTIKLKISEPGSQVISRTVCRISIRLIQGVARAAQLLPDFWG